MSSAEAQQAHQSKLAKSALLSTMLEILLDTCPICWILGSKQPVHTPFTTCRQLNNWSTYHPEQFGWIDFKKKIQSRKSCFGCGLPIEEYLPAAHKPLALGIKCPFNDFVVQPLQRYWLCEEVVAARG